ncbi:NAD(P)H-hydrate epimerase [Campylobacter concisus]
MRESKDVENSLNSAKCVIDGLFGSGLNRNLDEKHIELISKINASPRLHHRLRRAKWAK